MEQRIDIINKYRFLSGNKRKPLQTRIYSRLTFIIIFSILALLSICGVIFSMIVDWFNLDFNLTWNTSSTLVLSSIFCLLFLAESLYSYLLLKHLKRIENKDIKKNAAAVNQELNFIIAKQLLLTSNKFLFVFGIIILIPALMMQFYGAALTFVWPYFQIPLLIFYFLLFRHAIKNMIHIKRNNILFEITCIK